MNLEKIKEDFVHNVNFILELSKQFRPKNYTEFVLENSELSYLSNDSLKSLIYIVRALSKELHPDMQISSSNSLNENMAKELQSQLNQASAYIKKYGHICVDIDLKFEHNEHLYKQKNGIFKNIFNDIKETFVGENHNKQSDLYREIKDKDLKSLFINWDLSYKSLSYLNDDSHYITVYQEMLNDLFNFMSQTKNRDNVKLACHKMCDFILKDVEKLFENGSKYNIQKQFQVQFENLFVGHTSYGFDEKLSLNVKIFSEEYNRHLSDSRYQLNVNYVEFKERIVKDIADGFMENDRNVINNIKRNNYKIIQYLDNNYQSKSNFINDGMLLDKLEKLDFTRKKLLTDFLIGSNSINFQKVSANKSFLENVVIGENSWKFLSNEPQDYDWNQDTEKYVFNTISSMLNSNNQGKNVLHSNDLNVIVQYTKQLICSNTLGENDENAFIHQVELALDKANKFDIKNDLLTYIQSERDDIFLESIADLCVEKPELFTQLSIFKSYQTVAPNPQKVYQELEEIGIEKIKHLSTFKHIQTDYQLQSIGFLHKNNSNHQVNNFTYNVFNTILNHNLVDKPIEEKIKFSLTTPHMINVLNIMLSENIQTDNMVNIAKHLKNDLINLTNKDVPKQNINSLNEILSRYENTFKQIGVNLIDLDNLEYKDSVLYQYLNKKSNNGLDYKLNLLNDFNKFKDIATILNKPSGITNWMVMGLNYIGNKQPIFNLFLAYEQRDLKRFEQTLSQLNNTSMELSFKDFPLISYIGMRGFVSKKHELANNDFIQLLGEYGFQNALNQVSPFGKLKQIDFYSAHQKDDLFDIVQDKELFEKFNKNKTWKDKLMEASNLKGNLKEPEIEKVNNNVVDEIEQEIRSSSVKLK